METALPKARVIAELTRSPHRDLAAYLLVGRQAVLDNPEKRQRLADERARIRAALGQ